MSASSLSVSSSSNFDVTYPTIAFRVPRIPLQSELASYVGATSSQNQEAREATLAAKKAEHLKDEATLALEAARKELKACQLVVDEASEAARLREQVNAAIAPNQRAAYRPCMPPTGRSCSSPLPLIGASDRQCSTPDRPCRNFFKFRQQTSLNGTNNLTTSDRLGPTLSHPPRAGSTPNASTLMPLCLPLLKHQPQGGGAQSRPGRKV